MAACARERRNFGLLPASATVGVANAIGAAVLLPALQAVNESSNAAESPAIQADGGQYSDVAKLFCTADRCPAIVGRLWRTLTGITRRSNTSDCWRR